MTEQKQIAAPDDSSVGAVALAGAAALANFEEAMVADAGTGTQYDSTDLAIPFWQILQSNSPQVKEEDSRYLDGARAGMVMNNVTGELFDVRSIVGKPEPKPMVVIFGAQSKKMITEWKPDRGGFVGHQPFVPGFQTLGGNHIVTNPENGKKKVVNAEGNELIETDYHYPMLVRGPGETSLAILGMASTQLRWSRKLNSLINDLVLTTAKGIKYRPQTYQVVFALRTQVERKGEMSWWGWKIDYMGSVLQVFGEDAGPIYLKAKQYYDSIKAGLAVAKPVQEAEAPAAGESGSGEEVPF